MATSYVDKMRAEAQMKRDEAGLPENAGLKDWLLTRAAYFDRCADEAEIQGEPKLLGRRPRVSEED